MSADYDLFLEQQGERPVRKNPSAGAVLIASLSWHELQRLREATKRVFMQHYPPEFFTEREADRMIEALAPDVAERMVKALVDRKLYRRDGRIAYGRLKLDE